MKVVLWLVVGLLAAMWTGGAWLAATSMEWAAQSLANGDITDVARAMAGWPMPPWLALWVDPALWRALQDTFVAFIEWLQRLLPAAPSLAGWLAAAVWLTWGAGLLLMLTLAGGAHWLLGRLRSPTPRPA
jgi:hypothetical protein